MRKSMLSALILALASIQATSNANLLDKQYYDTELTQGEIDAYLGVEELLFDVNNQLASLGDEDPASFLEGASQMMQQALDQYETDKFRPECSRTGETRGHSIGLIRALVSVYHNAILGELDQLKQQSALIGSKSAEVSAYMQGGARLGHLDKYLTALFDIVSDAKTGRGRPARPSEPSGPSPRQAGLERDKQTTEEPNWFQRVMRSCGLNC